MKATLKRRNSLPEGAKQIPFFMSSPRWKESNSSVWKLLPLEVILSFFRIHLSISTCLLLHPWSSLYHSYPSYLDTLTPYHTRFWTKSIWLPVDLIKICWIDGKQGRPWSAHSVTSDLGLHCLLRPVCPNTWVVRWFFSGFSGFRPPSMNNRLDISEIFLKGP